MSQHKSDTNLLELITAFVDGEASPDEIISLEKLRRGETKIDQAIDAEIKIRQTLRLNAGKSMRPVILDQNVKPDKIRILEYCY
jgi:hypothetical protein